MPRLYREAPLNSIWEGSGNVNALDVMRAFAKQPRTLEAYRAEIEPALGDARLRIAADALSHSLAHCAQDESQARALVERMALLWQAALLSRDAANPVFDAFVESRIAGRGAVRWNPPASAQHRGIVERAAPRPRVKYAVEP